MKRTQKLLLFLLSPIIGVNVWAQENTVGTGGEANGAGGTVSYSVGQIAYSSQSGSSGNINQGVQQPLEFFSLKIMENEKDFQVQLFPNPVVAQLNVELSGLSIEELSYTLTDATGKIIQSETIQQEKIMINMADLSRANYFLNFTQKGKIVYSYQVIKN